MRLQHLMLQIQAGPPTAGLDALAGEDLAEEEEFEDGPDDARGLTTEQVSR